ncbi:MAG: phosphate transport system protein [Thermoplasmata archaeon]|jgi:phosphate transport system protein|nr:phosphate transport system protein [Thermoplasmata archaeon]
MTKEFHNEIDQLKARVLHMADQARLNLVEGVRSLVDGDAALARRVIQREEELNRLDVEIEAEALSLLALNQPMAADLRTIGASLKVITYIDRIGRYGYDIAKATLELGDQKLPRKPLAFNLMAEKAMEMYDRAIEAYKERDAAKARGVAAMDEVVDTLYDQIFRQAITYMMEDPRTITLHAHHILVARHLERTGDNARKIAEKALYMASGERRLPLR